MVEEKVLSLGKFSAVAAVARWGPYPPFWFTKNTFFGTPCKVKKTDNDAKGIITFNPSYLIKVTYSSSVLKFLNTESFSGLSANIRNNIQSLQLRT